MGRERSQASGTEQGVRAICGMNLNGLATRSMTGSGHGSRETRQPEPLGLLSRRLLGPQTIGEDYYLVAIKLLDVPCC
jgi:hypothetical protein